MIQAAEKTQSLRYCPTFDGVGKAVVVPAKNFRKAPKFWRFYSGLHSLAGMFALISMVFSWLACRIRNRVELELELTTLRHQAAVLHRQQSQASAAVLH